MGIKALKSLYHRGAVDADGKTGDGAGLQVAIPKEFFIKEIHKMGKIFDNNLLALGMIFLPRNDQRLQKYCKNIVEEELIKDDLLIYGWRKVPINLSFIGKKANSTRPLIVQVIFYFVSFLFLEF